MENKLTHASLKNIALATMLIDHFFAFIYKPLYGSGALYDLGRNIGRIAFALYAFMIAEGMRHSSSKTKYLMRLFIFALVSEIPFDLAASNTFWSLSSQNVFFTLFIGALSICIISSNRKALYPLVPLLCIFAQLMHTDYGASGVFLIIAFYIAGYERKLTTLVIPVFLIFYGLIGVLRYYSIDHLRVFVSFIESEFYAVLAIPLILMYNGQKGKPLNKWLYYTFYPVHLLIFGMIIWKI